MVSSEAVRRKMRRRHFIGLVGGSLAAWPLLARAEPKPSEKRRVGFLTLANADTQYFLSALTDGLRELGYGENSLHLEMRSAQNTAELLAAAAELLALKVEVLFAFQTPAAMAAREAVHDVPVVFLAYPPSSVLTAQRRLNLVQTVCRVSEDSIPARQAHSESTILPSVTAVSNPNSV